MEEQKVATENDSVVESAEVANENIAMPEEPEEESKNIEESKQVSGGSDAYREEVKIPENWPNDQNKLVYSVQNIFSQSECDWIKEKTDRYFEEEKKDDEYFLSVIKEDAELQQFIYDRIKPWVPEDFEKKHITGIYKDLRFLRYCPEKRSNLAAHFDGMTITEEKERSLITLHFYLNDVEEGGCTRFYCSKTGVMGKKSKDFVDYQPTMGSVLVFQQDMYHAGTAVIRGTEKYTLRAKVLYK